MSRGGDDPLLEIRVIGDWSQFDAEARQREQSIAGRDQVFAVEGRGGSSGLNQLTGFSPGYSPTQYMLPGPANHPYASSSSIGGGSFNVSVLQTAADKFGQALNQLTSRISDVASRLALPGPTAAMLIPGGGGGALAARTPSLARDPSIIDVDWSPANQLARRTGLAHQRPFRSSAPDPDVQDAQWYPSPPPISSQRMLPFQESGHRPYGGMAPRNRVYEGEEVDENGNPVGTPTGLTGGGGGPGSTPPGGGPRMWVPAGAGGGGGGTGGPGSYGTYSGGPMGPWTAGGSFFGGGASNGPGFLRRLWANRNQSLGSRGIYRSVILGLWDVHHTTEALREAEAQMPGAMTQEDMLQIQGQGIRTATSGLFSGIAGMALDMTGYGPRQTLNLIESERIRMNTQERTRSNYRNVRFGNEIEAATQLGTNEIERTRSRQRREKEVDDANTRLNTVNALLSQKTTETVVGRVLTGHWGTAWDIANQEGGGISGAGGHWSRTVDQITGGERLALQGEAKSLTAMKERATAQEAFEEKERQKDLQMNRMTIYRTTQGYLNQLPGVTRQQEQMSAVVLRQQEELDKVARFGTNQEFFETMKKHQAEIQAVTYQQGLENRVRDVETGTEVRASGLRADRRFYTAQREQIIGNARAAWTANERDPLEQKRIVTVMNAQLHELYTGEKFERQQQMTQVVGDTQTAQLQMAHMPLQALMRRLQTQRDTTLAAVPKDNPQLYQALSTQFAVQGQQIQQQYRQDLYMRNYAGQTEEQYTGQLAQAYGPGARAKVFAAGVQRIAREAEGRAEQRQFEDVTDVEGRERERRIGINRLGALRAQTIENMRAQEGSLSRTAFQGEGTGNMNEKLSSIDKGIQDLTRRIGTLVAQP
jgi:hypothetical protein